jgi:predicted transcriptional regulator
MKMPCEIIMWYILPGIRREIAKSLLKNGLNQKETAKKLGVTDAAVSQYLSEKRGGVEIKDKKILVEIKNSAKRIVAGDKSIMVEETCRICNLIKSSRTVSGLLYEPHRNKLLPKCFSADKGRCTGADK